MAFSEKVKTKALVACGRCCCICHKFCGNNIELHHIKSKLDGGDDSFGNAIPLCFDCHAIVRQYDPKHPKGTKFSEKELIEHRESWYKKVSQSFVKITHDSDKEDYEPLRIYHQKDYQNIELKKVLDGSELLSYMSGICAISYDDKAKTIEEVELVGCFLQCIRDYVDIEELLDNPHDRINVAFELSEMIKELDVAGFWVFVAIEKQILTGGRGNPELFPVLLIRIISKDSNEIIKNDS